MLILSHICRDMVIDLLQNLGFIMNIRKSILHPCHETEFLGMKVDSIKMTSSLAPEKVQKFSSQEAFYNSSGIYQGYRSPLIHYTSSGTCKNLVRISSTTANCISKKKTNHQSVITLNTKSRTELAWWIKNLRFCNSLNFSELNPQMII